jgi:hypothetical protein
MYACGTLSVTGTSATYSAIPELYQVSFDSNSSSGTYGQVTGETAVYQLTSQGGSAVDCTPLTENFNGTTDYLFAGVSAFGSSNSYTKEACIMNFVLPSTGITSGTPSAGYSLGGTNDGLGSSGIIVDNVSTAAGASQIYFGNLENGDATQISQSTLQ